MLPPTDHDIQTAQLIDIGAPILNYQQDTSWAFLSQRIIHAGRSLTTEMKGYEFRNVLVIAPTPETQQAYLTRQWTPTIEDIESVLRSATLSTQITTALWNLHTYQKEKLRNQLHIVRVAKRRVQYLIDATCLIAFLLGCGFAYHLGATSAYRNEIKLLDKIKATEDVLLTVGNNHHDLKEENTQLKLQIQQLQSQLCLP